MSMRKGRSLRTAALAGAAVLAVGAAALVALAAGETRSVAVAVDENFRIEHEIGHRFSVDPDHLPPRTNISFSNAPQTVPYTGQALTLPSGFSATVVATGLLSPRRMILSPEGDIVVAEQFGNRIQRLHDDGSGHLVSVGITNGFYYPYGLAFRGDELLVTDQNGIWRIPAGGQAAQAVTPSGVFGDATGHVNRPLAIHPHNGRLFVGVGSMSNIAVEPEPKATIQRFDADGTRQITFAAGTRNPTTLVFRPNTGDLWTLVQERDGLGNDLPSDYLTRVEWDGFYGWPYAYLGPHPQPGFGKLAPGKVAKTIVPDLLLQAHSSPLDLVFYEGDQFPPDFRHGVFLALKGSWNRGKPTGYKIVWVPFKNGRPQGYYENFAVGFWQSGNDQAQVWGRPAALAVMPDGSLLVADDAGGTIWRISYTGG